MLTHDGGHVARLALKDLRVGHHLFELAESSQGLLELFTDFHEDAEGVVEGAREKTRSLGDEAPRLGAARKPRKDPRRLGFGAKKNAASWHNGNLAAH
jgi:hypothetical protein